MGSRIPNAERAAEGPAMNSYSLGIVLAFISTALHSFSILPLRWIGSEMSVVDIAFFRSLFSIILLSILHGVLVRDPSPLSFPRLASYQLFPQAALRLGSFLLWIYGLSQQPASIALSLAATKIFWIGMMSHVVFGTRLRIPQWISCIVGFIGIIIITNPAYYGFNLGIPALFGSAILGAACNLHLSRLLINMPPTRLALSISFLEVLSLSPFIFSSEIWSLGLHYMPPLLLLSATTTISNSVLIVALRGTSSQALASIDLFRLPLSLGVAALFLGETMHIADVLGSSLILGANVFYIAFQPGKRRSGVSNSSPLNPT
ncbi:EamA family transporter [Sinorhizobium medicae]|nr:EamA family transporter [Sinorhizobium medicae]